MEALEHLQGQLESLGELRSIVKTMKALSAASIRQYQQAVTALGRYYHTVELGLHVLLRDLQDPLLPSGRDKRAPRLAAIVFGSDHGLCGRFNEEVTTYALRRMDTVEADSRRLVLAVGARAQAGLEQEGQAVEKTFLVPGAASQITTTVQRVLLQIDAWRAAANVRYVRLYYNRTVESGRYQPTELELLPLSVARFRRLEEQAWPSRSLPIYTMDRQALLASLLRQYFFVSVYRACAESQASEHASRLSAMQSAQRNLDERIEEVTMLYRRARQNAITSELLDVVAGFEAITLRQT
ncbi:MAG: F0F1 ATP synthase subunit gamma [Gammaproteobacteria bacterium]